MKFFRNGIKIKNNESSFNLDYVISFILLFIAGALLITICVFVIRFYAKIIELLFLYIFK